MRATLIRLAAPLVVAVIALGIGAQASAQDSSPGRLLFVKYGCWQCHGYLGQGGASGPRVAPTLLPMIAFEQFVRRPVSVMPAYAPGVLPDEDLQKIYAYLGSIEEPPKLEEIPELR